MRTHTLISLIYWTFSAFPVLEASEKIETERHDFTQSTTTVGQGVFQLEGGYTYFYQQGGADREETHTGPELMLRYGLNERVEVRVRWDFVAQFKQGDTESQRLGSEDTRVSLKLRVNDQFGWLPESALEIRTTWPTGGHGWGTRQVNAGLDYIYGWRLSDQAEIYGSTGVSMNGLGDFSLLPEPADGDDFVLWTQSLALGYEINHQYTVYGEVFTLLTDGLQHEESIAFFNAGLDYYVHEDFVLDLRVGTGLTRDSEDLLIGVGG